MCLLTRPGSIRHPAKPSAWLGACLLCFEARQLLCLLFVWFALLTPTFAAQAAMILEPIAVVSLDKNIVEAQLSKHSEQWFDGEGKATAAQAQAAARSGQFIRAFKPGPVNLHPNAALWQRFEIRQDAAQEQQWFLQISSPSLDHASLHWQDDLGNWHSAVSGDAIAVDQWPLPDSLPLFQLSPDIAKQADGVSELWLRIAHKRLPIWVEATLIADTRLHELREKTYLMFGVFFGLVVLATLICIQHIIQSRDLVFAAYLGLVASMTLMQLQLTGLGGQYAFNASAYWNDYFSFAFALLYGIAACIFTAVACGVAKFSPRSALACKVWVGVGATLMVFEAVSLDSAVVAAANVYLAASMVMLVLLCFWAHSHGEKHAMGVLLGITPAIVGAAFPLLRNNGVLPTGFISQYGSMIGAAFEILILILVLTKRSQELQETALRTRALVSTDPLTGLPHDSLLLHQMTGTLARCARYKHQCAVILVELHNLDTYAGSRSNNSRERALVLAASRIRGTTRDVDAVCRIGNGQFMMLLEGPQTTETANARADRLLTGLIQPTPLVEGWGHIKKRLYVALLASEEIRAANHAPQDVVTQLLLDAQNASQRDSKPVSQLNPKWQAA